MNRVINAALIAAGVVAACPPSLRAHSHTSEQLSAADSPRVSACALGAESRRPGATGGGRRGAAAGNWNMHWVVARMRTIMLVCGVVTCSMIYAALAPQAALRSTFGATLEGPLGDIVVRSWGVLIALSGGMLIYGAFNAAIRPFVLTVAGLGKVAFIGLVLAYGTEYLHRASVAIAVDSAMVVVFIVYLVAVRRLDLAPRAGSTYSS